MPKGKSQFNSIHAAGDSAMGFYYQSFFALYTLLSQNSDNAVVGVEQLDDVVLSVDGRELLYQLKHSIKELPPPISIKSTAFWKTIKAWIDILPQVTLSEASFHLITVSEIQNDSVLAALLSESSDKTLLVKEMKKEAQRVVDSRSEALKNKKKLPYADRYQGCESFLALSDTYRLSLMKRSLICNSVPAIDKIEDEIANKLVLFPENQRKIIASRLLQWWDREIVYSLCGKRENFISRFELQNKISAIVGDLERDILVPDFEMVMHPDEYQPDGILTKQINLVNGTESDLVRAIREEWRAREQRSKWANDNPALKSTINEYDKLLVESWSDKHSLMKEETEKCSAQEKSAAGLDILRWSHFDAPNGIRPISNNWNSSYYIRGSYQVLAISQEVGWHPDYKSHLSKDIN